jgi:hypothetical protein
LQVLDQIRVSNSAQSQGSIVLGDGSSTAFNVGIARWNINTGSFGAGGIGYFSQGTGNVGGHYFYTGDAAVGSQTARMVITPAGDVGIGTTSPNRKLEVSYAGADNFIRVNTTGATKSGIEFASSGTVYSQLYFNNESPYDLSLLQQYTTGSLILGTNSTEKARIDSSGRLLVGTSSSSGDPLFVVHGRVGSATEPGTMALSRGGTIIADYNLGQLDFTDGSNNVGARILGTAETGWGGSGDAPGRLTFSTTPDSGSSPVERLRIASGGDIRIGQTTSNAPAAANIAGAAIGQTGYLSISRSI